MLYIPSQYFLQHNLWEQKVEHNLQDQKVDEIDEYWQVIDVYDREREKTLKDLLNEADSLQRLKTMNQALHDKYPYLECIDQPIEYIGWYEGNKVSDEKLRNQEVCIEDQFVYITPLEALQISEETQNYFTLSCIEGRLFTPNDFDGTESAQVPVILGNHYLEDYNIGDEINCYYLFKNISLKIIGFLKPNSKIFDYDTDNYIIMPALELGEPNTVWDEKTQKLLYGQKNNGEIINTLKVDGASTSRQIEKIAEELGLKYALLRYENVKY